MNSWVFVILPNYSQILNTRIIDFSSFQKSDKIIKDYSVFSNDRHYQTKFSVIIKHIKKRNELSFQRF